MKKAVHNFVLAFSFATLALLATMAQATHSSPPRYAETIDEVREQVRVRNASDGGCG